MLPGGVFIPETERTPQLASAKPLIAVSTPVTQSPGGAPGPVRAVAPQTVPGTGVFVRPSTSGSGGVKPTGDGDITFNFVNADVRDVLRELLGDQLHLQYTVDTKVQATVTAQTSGPIARTAVLPTLENILRASGVALVQAGGVYRVVPLEDANRASAATVAQPTTTQPGYGVRVLPLKFVKAAELKPLLDPFVPTGGVLETDNARNLLIVSGPSGDLDGFAALVNQFDVDWLAGKSFAIYPLHAGKAKEVTTELQAVLEQGSDGSGPLAGLVRVVPVERLNAILVITSRPSYLSQMKAWVDRLDYGDANATPRFFEYQVQKTRAVDLARVLRQLFPSSDVRIVRPEKSPRPSFTRLGTPVAVPSANGTVSSGLSGTAAAAAVPAAAPAQQQTADEDRDQPGGGAPAGGPAGAGELALPPVRIVADEKNNTLVIFARPGDYRMIEKMLQKLDIAPQQVLIEATIAELTLNDDLQYGVQYFLKSGNKQFELEQCENGIFGGGRSCGCLSWL